MPTRRRGSAISLAWLQKYDPLCPRSSAEAGGGLIGAGWMVSDHAILEIISILAGLCRVARSIVLRVRSSKRVIHSRGYRRYQRHFDSWMPGDPYATEPVVASAEFDDANDD